jgi:nitroimidazol reductase NimA-like FMN-containing flavoprotein (pyridoxamine 5'-phosphate oxidase superfamily)
MSPQEIEDFLSEGNIARIATVKPDNSPYITPVWYLCMHAHRNGDFNFNVESWI